MQKIVGTLLERLTAFVFPVILIGCAVLAFAWQRSEVAASRGSALGFAVWEQKDSEVAVDPLQALGALQSQARNFISQTQRSTRPFWILFNAPVSGQDAELLIELPSRHAIRSTCWDASNGSLLGAADYSSGSGVMSRSRAGFKLELPSNMSGVPLVCMSSFRGPARITVEAWSPAELGAAQLAHKQTGVLIEGAIGVLAVFMLLTAIVNGSPLYLAFVGGLILNMRMAALSVGTDFYFFGSEIPPAYLFQIRQLTLVLYFANTVALFSMLFKTELALARVRWPLTAHEILAVALLCLSPLLAYETVLPILWVATFTVVAVMLGYLCLILRTTHSRVAAWYGASIVVTLISTLNEVIVAATGARLLESGLNSVTGAIASALLASAAVAEHMRTHRLQSIRAQKLLKAAYQDSPIGLFSVGQSGEVIKANPAFFSMLKPGASDRPVLLEQFFERRVVDALQLLRTRTGGGSVETETKALDESGGSCWFLVKASTVDGSITECSLQDITERVRATERLEFLASHDALTGCLNLRGLGQRVGPGTSQPRALAYFDLDRFKLINDLYGHAAGDQVLIQVAERMRGVLGPDDLLARIGGDEFVVIFFQGDLSVCELRCNSIATLIGTAPFLMDSQSFALDISGGLVGADQLSSTDLKDIISAADTLCRMAKKRSSQRLVVMQKGDRFFQQHQDELDLINCLERGETPEGLFLVMQPEVSLSRPFDSLNFEILIRLRKPDGTVLAAGTIIEAAESHGKTAIIDRWVVATSIQWLEAHADQLTRTHFVGVNLSGGSLNDEVFTEELFALFEQHPVALAKICLEITETVAITDMRNMQRFIDRVRSMGGKVALDDFGAGYSSFGYLKGLSVDSLKLDGSLIKDAVQSQAGQAIVGAIAGLVKNLGMKSVGEFAENLPTIKVLYEAGIDYVQGYGISKPVSPESILSVRSGADFIEDPAILAFLQEVQGLESLPLFQDSRRGAL